MAEQETVDAAGAVDRSAAERMAQTLRALSDPTRIQLVSLIVASPGGKALVGTLATELGLTQPTVSHHMRIMTEDGILHREQEGRQAWYSVAPERLPDLVEFLGQAPKLSDTDFARVLPRIAADLALRFDGVFSPETVDRYVRESHALLGDGARITRYLPSLTARFAADRLRALASSTGAKPRERPEVLFVCVQNAGRSQMASALLRSIAGDRVRVLTAGSEPAPRVNQAIVAVLDEVGVSIAGEFPKPLTDEVVRAADWVVTMGCGDACPVYPGRRYLDWELRDPVGLALDGIREVRDEIDARVRALLREIEAAGVVESA